MNSFFYVASRLSKILIHPDELSEITVFFKQHEGNEKVQKAFFEYCKKWKLAPWIFVQMQRNSLIVYLCNRVAMDFLQIHEKTKEENERRNKEALRLLKAFTEKSIVPVILKGNLFIYSVYNDTGYKKMNDFDMLIKPCEWKNVQDIYFKLKYIPLGFGWTGEKQKAAKFSHAGMSFLSRNYHCITGTQWGLKSPTSKYKVDFSELWNNTSVMEFNGVQVRKMSVEYNLLHLILHMGTFKCGVRDCMDVYNLLLCDESFNEDSFVELCRKSNALDKAYFTLSLANYCSQSISESLLNKLRPKNNGFLLKRLNARINMIERGDDFHSSYNDYFHDVEMTVFYFSLFHQFHIKVYFYGKLFKQMLWPKSKLSHQFSDLGNKPNLLKRIKARLKAPSIAFNLIGEEIGLGITFFLFIKLFFDTLVSVKNYFVKKENYFDYLKGRNIDPEEIKRVVKNIQ